MNERRTHTGRSRGFTLLELMLALAVLVLLLGTIAMVTLSGRRAFEAAQEQGDLATRARRTVERIADEVAAAGLATLDPHPAPGVHFGNLALRRPTGLVAGATQWGDTTRIRRSASPTDPDDGVDNDANGLVDDGQVVLTLHELQANERTIVLARGVPRFFAGELFNGVDDNANGLADEGGLAFGLVRETPTAEDEVLAVRLCLEGIDAQGRRLVRTIETRVRPRN